MCAEGGENMKLVNPMGRQAETGANYDGNVARGGCVCSGTVEIANSHDQGPSICNPYCAGGTVNHNANEELAHKK